MVITWKVILKGMIKELAVMAFFLALAVWFALIPMGAWERIDTFGSDPKVDQVIVITDTDCEVIDRMLPYELYEGQRLELIEDIEAGRQPHQDIFLRIKEEIKNGS